MWTAVIGPIGGLYFGTFACPVGELGESFVGYFKIFRSRPTCYCDADHLDSGVSAGSHSSPEAALHAAALVAREHSRGAAFAQHDDSQPTPFGNAVREVCPQCGQRGDRDEQAGSSRTPILPPLVCRTAQPNEEVRSRREPQPATGRE
jgi:hypothetical protein